MTLDAGRQRLADAMMEADLEAAVEARCKALGLLRAHTWNSQRSPAGWPDDVIGGPFGVMFRELKRQGSKGRVSAAQQAWLDALVAQGLDAGVWRPSDLLDGTIDRELDEVAGLRRDERGRRVQTETDQTRPFFEEGRAAAIGGKTYTSCPYTTAQGSPDRVKAFAWRRGFKQGEVDEADGEHFKTK